MRTANIFDVRRFSTHDGAGLRTTIFFKGCPLCCVWCQNPEGIDPTPGPVWFANRCISCGTCLKTSKEGGVTREEGGICLRRDRAEDWVQIIDACPAGAIAWDARPYTVPELVEEVRKDAVFFRRGGGVTLSGGEPLMQGAFAIDLLEALKGEGFHTAVETSLQIPADTLERALPYLDQVFADMKLADREAHRQYTGVYNDRILDNLRLLLTSEHRDKAVIRTPLIPGYTATEENLSACARFLSGLYPQVRYELLNYNPLAQAKYHLVGRDYCFADNPKQYTREQMLAFGEIVQANGIEHLILEL